MKGAILTLALFAILLPWSSANAQVIYPNRGGTGTTTAPSLGQVLVGQPNGTYAPQATSTLGYRESTFGTTSIDTEAKLEAILTDVTNVLTNNDSTSDLTEGSNLYYTIARVQSALQAGDDAIFVNSTTTNATTTNLAVTGRFNFLGTNITNVGTWFSGLFDTNFASKSTSNLTEGSNLYYTDARARNAISGSSGISYSTSTGAISLDASGNWTGTFDGQEGSYYLSRANHTGTQTASTISDFTPTARAVFSTDASGLSYNSSTGVLSEASGYSIPKDASSTEWANTHNTVAASSTFWDIAYGWGNHATAGYLTEIATGTVRGMFSAGAGLSYSSASGQFANTGVLSIGGQTGTVSTSSLHVATSSVALSLLGFDPLNYLTLAAWDATTTDALDEGITNLYFTNARADARITAQKGQADGLATLDGSGKVPVTQLPNSIMEYQGTWNATTNTPTLADGVGSTGDVYRVSVAGSQDLGSGSISFVVGDYVIYNGSTWEKADTTDAVSSVNGLTGDVVLDTDDIAEGSNLYYTDARTRQAISETATGLDYSNSTGVFSLTSGYNIPLSASSTEQHNFFAAPSLRITDGDALTWSGNTLNFDGGNTPGGQLGGTWASPTIDDLFLVNSADDVTTGSLTATHFIAGSSTATSTLAGAVQIGATTGNNALKITAATNYSSSNSTGGLVNLTNTSNSGPALVVYTNQASSAGNLANFRCDNASMAHDCVKVDHDGTGDGLAVAATASSSNAISASNSGLDHTINASYTGTTALKGALNLTSTNTTGSVFQATGNPLALGVGKITHNGTGDANSSILSLAASDTGYLGQGIFIDMATVASTTQKILNLRADGSEKLTLLGNGNLGIGTSSPIAKLTVGDVPASGQMLNIGNATTSGTSFAVGINTDGGRSAIQTFANGSLRTAFGNNFLVLNGASIYGRSDTSLSNSGNFALNGSDGSAYFLGNVGIGTTTPEEKLHVAGGYLLTDNTYGLAIKDSTKTSRTVLQMDSSNNLFLGPAGGSTPIMFRPGASTAMTITTSGGVGIGTTTPDQALVVNGNIQAGNTGSNGNLYFGGPNVSLRSSYAFNALGFYTSGSERIRIDTSGKVGIGTTTPASTLSVVGDMRLTGAFRDTNNNSGTAGMVLQSTGTETQWVATSSLGISGGGVPGGATTQLQYNSGGAFAGLSTLTTDGSSITMSGTSTLDATTVTHLGVGTSSSAAPMNISGTNAGIVFEKTNGDSPVSLYLNGANTLTLGNGDNFAMGNGTVVIDSNRLHYAGDGSAINAAFRFSAEAAVGMFRPTTSTLAFTAGAERMRITSAGFVGIGTTTPLSSLQVSSSTANSTTTVTIGRAGQTKGSCLELYTPAGTVVYVVASSTSPYGFERSTSSCK